jgi:hypothetical protein
MPKKRRDTSLGNLASELRQGRRDTFIHISRRANNTTIGTLRKTYGSDFARGYRRDTKLSTVLESTGAESLNEFVEHYERAKALAKSAGTSALSNTIISITSSHFEPALKNLAKK